MRDSELIARSGLFDADWYCAEYPDVRASGMAPFAHFLRIGLPLLRNPGPGFDCGWYLDSYPDVAAEGWNPLLHYLHHGCAEGRAPQPLVVAPARHQQQVDVIVPVFDALEHVQACLAALHAHQDGCKLRVLVVDDGSSAPTAAWLHAFCAGHDGFTLLRNESNLGYTAAMNRGLQATQAPWIVMLNSDTLVAAGWLKGLLRCISSDPALGIVGPLSNAASWQNVPLLLNDSNEFAVNRLPAGMDVAAMARLVAAASTRRYPRVPVLNGFCLLLRRQVLQAVGLLDQQAFPCGYGEENDFCLRAAEAGYALAVADDVYIHHVKSASFGHEKRRELSARGAQALCKKYGEQRMQALSETMKASTALAAVRRAIQAALAAQREAPAPAPDLLSLRVLYLLRGPAGGGGGHSVMQEAAELQRLGVTVKVAVEPAQLAGFAASYRDLPEAAALLAGWDESRLLQEAAHFDVAVATICTSMRLLQALTRAHPGLQPAYYVQDYEPLFYPPGTPTHDEALASYTLVPGTALFAKTGWVAAQVEAGHGVQVDKVMPGVDLALYRPQVRPARAALVVAAMIRPQTPRRGAARTMRVLGRVARRLGQQVSFKLFGCEPGESLLRSPEHGFAFEACGVLERPQVAALLGQADLFVDLSDYQAFGRTALEAMACGCAAVVPRQGGCDEYAIDGVNTLVVDSEDEDACVERICALLGEPARLARLQQAGLLAASRFGLRGAALSVLQVLARAASLRRGAQQAPVAAPAAPAATSTARASAVPELVAPARAKPHASRQPKLPLTVLVITWDVGHNPLGRSYMLAEVLDRVARNVVLAGFGFDRYGEEVWEPVRNARLPVIRMPGEDMPAFLDQVERIAARVKPDVVIACKPRLPSVQLAAAIKEKAGCPLILDIDDHELAFFNGGTELELKDLAALPAAGSDGVEPAPFGELWTRLAQNLRSFADEIIVSNIALQREFGGTVLPHVRDERVFSPALHSRQVSRHRYGVAPDAKVVLFFGTPRVHKGIESLAKAVAGMADPAWRLVVAGSSTDRSVTNRVDKLAAGRVTWLPNQPFDAIASIIALADVVCLPQDEAHPVSQFQLPAKAIDAIGMGVPLLVSQTPPLMQLVRDGVAIALEPGQMAAAIMQAEGMRAQWAEKVRSTFLEKYSYASAETALREILQRAVRKADPARTRPLAELVRQQRRLLGHGALPAALAETGRDVVIFWKQNDSGLYGRRVDMVARYLASRDDVRRVLLVDAPISEHDLLRLRDSNASTSHDRLVYTRTYEKQFGLRDQGKLSHHVFIYPAGVWRTGEAGRDKPLLTEGYANWLQDLFQREGLEPTESIFWFYPRDYHAPALLARFKPAQTVVDVVDDHRAWPGTSEREKRRLWDNYCDVLAHADLAFVNCDSMASQMRPLFDAVRLVPNGCDDAPPAVQPVGDRHFDALCQHTGRVIGYVGNLESKIDIALLEKIARRFTDCKLVLLGSTHTNPAVLELQRLPNVLMPGAVPYEQLGAWMARFHVGIIPHLDTPLTRSMNPLKLYVYLAHQLPVVTSGVCNVDLSSRAVRVGTTHDDFLAQLEQALAAGMPAAARTASYVRKNSWRARLAPHVDELFAMTKAVRNDRDVFA